MVMTPQLKELIDKVNSGKRTYNYTTTDKQHIKIQKENNRLMVTTEDTESGRDLISLLTRILDMALRGELQRKPIDKN